MLLVEVLRRSAFALVGLRRRAVAPGIHHHAQLVAHIEPDLRLVGGEAEDVHVLGFEVAHVGLGEGARLAHRRRNAAAGRIDRDAAQKDRPAIQMKLAVPNLQGTETKPNGPLGENPVRLLGGHLELVKRRGGRLPQIRFQAGDGMRGGRSRPALDGGLAQRALPEHLAGGCAHNDPAQVHCAEGVRPI